MSDTNIATALSDTPAVEFLIGLMEEPRDDTVRLLEAQGVLSPSFETCDSIAQQVEQIIDSDLRTEVGYIVNATSPYPEGAHVSGGAVLVLHVMGLATFDADAVEIDLAPAMGAALASRAH